jgi:putative tricarboxylic transport membrane protein
LEAGLLLETLGAAVSPQALLVGAAGLVFGILVGALPGLGPPVALTLLLPFSIFLPLGPALILLGAAYMGSVYGGSISAVLVNVPGDPTSIVTALDGYPMTQKGEGRSALAAATTASCLGGLVGVILLMTVAQPLSRYTLRFGPAETFLLVVFALVVVISTLSRSVHPVRSVVSGGIGLLLGLVGYHTVTGAERFTLGFSQLHDGLNTVAVTVGAFAVSEALMMVGSTGAIAKTRARLAGSMLAGIKSVFQRPVVLLQSSLIGSFIGAIPGPGGLVANFVAYMTVKERSKDPDSFGKGNVSGVIAAEASNNATVGTSLIPTLGMGVPGSISAAIVLGALIAQGLPIGPRLFLDQAFEMQLFFWGLVISCFGLLVVGNAFASFFAKVAAVPVGAIAVLVLAVSLLGAYAGRQSYADVYVALAIGLLVFFMRRNGFPQVPFIMAFILGPMADVNYFRAVTMHGNLWGVITASGIAIVLATMGALLIAYNVFIQLRKRQTVRTRDPAEA